MVLRPSCDRLPGRAVWDIWLDIYVPVCAATRLCVLSALPSGSSLASTPTAVARRPCRMHPACSPPRPQWLPPHPVQRNGAGCFTPRAAWFRTASCGSAAAPVNGGPGMSHVTCLDTRDAMYTNARALPRPPTFTCQVIIGVGCGCATF
eukprot:scaffold50095_cov39-Tisochrysis_lutea.AAC.2